MQRHWGGGRLCERLCKCYEGEFSLCNTVATNICIILTCSLSLEIRTACKKKTALRRAHIAYRHKHTAYTLSWLYPTLLIFPLLWFVCPRRSLLQQLQRLQALVSGKVPRSCKIASTQTGTCLMVCTVHLTQTQTFTARSLSRTCTLIYTHVWLFPPEQMKILYLYQQMVSLSSLV